MCEIVDVVDALDRVIGQAYRDELGPEGLLHRAVHVWFVTKAGEIIFQVRGANKDTNPNMLDATVSGHIPSGESYLMAAVRETFEETGIKVAPEDFHFLGKIPPLSNGYGKIDPVFREFFLYFFDEDISKLKVESGEGAGFKKIKINEVLSLRPGDREAKMIVPGILRKPSLLILEKARRLILDKSRI